MVVVLAHEIAAVFLFNFHPENFLTSNSHNYNIKTSLKELLKKLEQTTDATGCFVLIDEAIKAQTTKPVFCIVYLADVDSGTLRDAEKNPLPNKGICWEVLKSRETKSTKLLDQNDPIAAKVKEKCSLDHKYVCCHPVVDEGQVRSIIVVLTNSAEDFSPTSLKPVTEQIVGCYRRLCKCHTQSLEQNSTSTQPVQVHTSLLKEAIIQLCGELYDQDASDLQIKVLKFLEDHTNAECAFLLLVVPETHELFCQVIHGKVLDEEIRFPGHKSSFSTALETKNPITLDDIPLDKRPGIEKFVGCKLRSLLCVPVSSRADEKLIAIACVVNKKDKESFNHEDINVIKQCFQYTSTVLTSTLAFQNERKLKIQTQAMLQVARNLFTHLGEFTLWYSKSFDRFPFIKSGQFEIDTSGGIDLEHGHCRPCMYKQCGHQKNNSARLEKYLKIDSEIEKQEKIANMLTGAVETKKSPEKKHQPIFKSSPEKKHQPILKSQDKQKCKTNSPEKHYGQPYSKERKALEYIEFTPILESTRSCKPDLVLETECALQENSLLENECDLNLPEDEVDEKEHEVDEISNLSDNLELPPFTPTYERTARKFFTPIGGEESEDAADNMSYETADSPVESTMYSACEDTEETQDRSEDNTLDEEASFFDTWKEHELKLNTSCSDTILIDNKDELSRHSHVSDNDFEQPNARMSNSEPSLGNISEPFIDRLEIADSKPELNEAFIKGKSDSTISGDSNSTLQMKVSAYNFIGDPSETSLKGRTRSIIIEDVDSCQKLTMCLQVHTSDSDDKMSQITNQEVQFSPSTEYIRSIQVPDTDNIPLDTNDLTKLLREIMQEARNLTQAERCSVFLIDQETEELVAKVFDGVLANDNEVQAEIRMPITQGIAGHVATTGNLLNIKDAYAHPLFYRGIDDSTGFRTRNILCFPIKNETDNVLGVAQLCNKMNGPYFTTFDEDVASAFAVYCCISISHSLMYQKVIAAQYRNSLANELMVYHMKSLMYQKLQQSQHRNKLANELMIYHMQVATDEVTTLTLREIPPPSHWHPDFSKFCYPPREIPENETDLACLTMFEDLGFITRWRIKRETLARFMLMVKKGYRNPPYHNWMHAFAVAHFCYLCIKNLNLSEYLEDIELFALFVSCLCHDIDHRGTNNSYQVASKSVLAALYSSEGAVLERHHFAQTMCIINTEGCNVYENLSSKDYQQVLDLMRDIILATDLAHHLKILKNIEAMAKDKYDKANLKHRKLLLCLIMTASDLSDQTKPWDSTKHIAALIYNEFFSQGDLEKSLGRTPPEMMDREKARIPDLQIGFLDHIALPVYRVLEELFPQAMCVHQTVKDNHRHWDKICALIKLKRGGSCEQMSYDQILALEEEANNLQEDELKSYQQNGH